MLPSASLIKKLFMSSPNATIKEDTTPKATPIPAGPIKPPTIDFNAPPALPVSLLNR